MGEGYDWREDQGRVRSIVDDWARGYPGLAATSGRQSLDRLTAHLERLERVAEAAQRVSTEWVDGSTAGVTHDGCHALTAALRDLRAEQGEGGD